MKKIAAFALAAAAVTLSAPASAEFAKPEDAIKYRQSAFVVMAQHFSRIGAMANGKAPFDAKAAQESAVWAEQAKFKDHSDKLQAEATKLAAAAKTGNLDSVKTAFGATAGTCKACHDNFRSK